MTNLTPTTIAASIGTCPCCGYTLRADVDVVREVTDPRMDPDNPRRAFANVTCRIVAMRLDHTCTEADR